MYYVSQQSLKSTIPHKTMVSVIISTLGIPSKQRSNQDHQLVFRFFQNNKILCQIERVKSLNARQQCVANLQIATKRPDPSQSSLQIIDRLILEKDEEQQQKYYVLLDEQIKNQIMKTDEKYLRKNIQNLKKYMILKQMKYSQMLHLAYYMDQISFKYKEDVYKQGDIVDYLYLVQKGEFHYAKTFINELQPTQKRKKKDRPKRYDAKLDNPNRIKNSISTQMKIGVIQGDCGQSFGQDEILNQKRRQYTVKCMSTQNLLLRVPHDKYRNVIQSSITRMEWLKRQNLKKLQLKGELFSKMLSIKHNHKALAEYISRNQFNKTEDLRINSGNSIIILQNNPNKNFLLPKIRSHSMASDELSPKYSYNSIDKSRIEQQQSIKKSQQTEQNEDDGTFALTRAKYKKRIRKQRQNGSLHSPPLNSNSSNNSLLPTIISQKSKVSSIHQTYDSNAIKGWSGSRPILDLRGLNKKFSGMIDSNSLIRQKEQILNIKVKMSKQPRVDIFPFQAAQKKGSLRPQTLNLSKQQKRQMRSAAHSKIFMQKLLIHALKKAGYNPDQDQSNDSQSQQQGIDIKNNLRVPKIRKYKQRSDSSFQLQNNAFDQCYFKKI